MKTTAVSPKMGLNIDVASLSNRGRKRHLNEDAIFDFTTHSPAGTSAGLYLVCDSGGGSQSGDVASQLVVETVVAQLVPFISKYQAMGGQLYEAHTPELQQCVEDAVSKANERIHAYNQEKPEGEQSGTTLTMAFLQDQEAIVANVGGSRAYVWHEKHLTQITDDHLCEPGCEAYDTMGLVDSQRPSETWAMGLNSTVKVELYAWELAAGDKLLLCSDGLWQAFADEEDLATFLYENRHAHDICQQLIFEANRRDGSDNISAVVICA